MIKKPPEMKRKKEDILQTYLPFGKQGIRPETVYKQNHERLDSCRAPGKETGYKGMPRSQTLKYIINGNNIIYKNINA